MSSKRLLKYFSIFILFSIVAYSTYSICYYQINSYLFYLTSKQPVSWKNISFNFKPGMKYIADEEWIQIVYYGKELEGSILIEKCKFSNIESVIQFMKKRTDEYTMISYHKSIFNGINAFNVETINNTTKYYTDIYYLIKEGYTISFYGPENNYSKYKHTMDSISIINK